MQGRFLFAFLCVDEKTLFRNNVTAHQYAVKENDSLRIGGNEMFEFMTIREQMCIRDRYYIVN